MKTQAETTYHGFHLSQSLIRHMTPTLKTAIQTNVDLEIEVKSLLALAFVPVADVLVSYILLHATFLNPEVKELSDYFKITYIGSTVSSPSFFPALWNVYSRVINQTPRTTNHVEGWNNRFNSYLPGHHPPFSTLYSQLQREQRKTEEVLQLRVAGEPSKPMDIRYKSLNDRLVNLVQTYNNRDRLEYIKGIALNLCQITREKKGHSAKRPRVPDSDPE